MPFQAQQSNFEGYMEHTKTCPVQQGMEILSALYPPPVMFWDGTENSTVKRIFLKLMFFREAHSR